jgi:hypothetical protein
MTITSTSSAPTTLDGPRAGRRILVALAVIYLGFFVVLMATGADREPDADPSRLIADYDTSRTMIQIVTYSTVVAGTILVFLGAALRSVLTRRSRRWTADVAFLGFVLMGLTLVTWAISSLALFHAVDIGDTGVVRAINIIDTTNFPLAMLSMSCAMIGVGVTALPDRTLPTWLCWASIVLGAMAPLGPLAFAPFFLFAIWTVVIAAMARLSEV